MNVLQHCLRCPEVIRGEIISPSEPWRQSRHGYVINFCLHVIHWLPLKIDDVTMKRLTSRLTWWDNLTSDHLGATRSLSYIPIDTAITFQDSTNQPAATNMFGVQINCKLSWKEHIIQISKTVGDFLQMSPLLHVWAVAPSIQGPYLAQTRVLL